MVNIAFITGGVISSLGKGIYAASLARLLDDQGVKVNMMKCDPYLNVDPGTMSPIEHGEVFVTYDGGETDLDIGHYERFLGHDLSKLFFSYIREGLFKSFGKERAGGYLGKTVQVIPHITDAIKEEILNNTKGYDLLFVEVGGVVGDIESLPYLEAIRQLIHSDEVNTFLMHLTYVPYIRVSKELKTKPTQHSVKELQGLGINPNMIVTRNEVPLTSSEKEKISLFCNVNKDNVIENLDIDSVYEIPLYLKKQKVDEIVIDYFKFKVNDADHAKLINVVNKLKNSNIEKTIGIVGKYTKLEDSYKSVIEAIKHASIEYNISPKIKLIDSRNIELSSLSDLDAIIVPGGFGKSGIDGKIATIKYARENNVPFLGICLGMQLTVLEFANNVCGLSVSHQEIDSSGDTHIIKLMEEHSKQQIGGTLRLGNYDCRLEEDSKSFELYGKDLIVERHRHRYEFNNDFREVLEQKGLRIVGVNPKENLVEVVENTNNDYFIGTQYHPELTSKLTDPHPLFLGLLKSSLDN